MKAMWRQFRIKKARANLLLFFGLVSIAVLAFQNCVPSNLQTTLSSVRDLKLGSGGGNGEPYDGKPTYVRLVPGWTCDNQAPAIGSLDIHGATATLITNENACSGQSTEVPVSDLEHSSFSSRYIGYQEGVYTYTHDRNENIQKGIFTEAWCRAMKTDRSASVFELAVEWQELGDIASLFHMTGATPDPVSTSTTRRLDVDHVSYETAGGVLQIYFQQKVPGTRKVAGFFQEKINSIEKPVPVECLMGGQFDPIAPTFEYPSSSQKTLAIGEPLNGFVPSVNRPGAQFSISAGLPAGLQFNPSNGGIQGAASKAQKRQTLQVSALFPFGRVTRQLSIGVAPVVKVDQNSSTEPCRVEGTGCDLQGALALANQMSPLPLIAQVSKSLIELQGAALTLTGDLSVIGVGGMATLVDAKSLSAHFHVAPGAHLEIQRLRLIHGKNASGGSISVKNGGLVVRNSVFEANQTQDVAPDEIHGWGGAIYLNGGSLEVFNSEFLNNQSDINTAFAGGAIAVQAASMVSVRDSVFKGNRAQRGGALYFESFNSDIFQIQNSVFESNSALHGGAVYNWLAKLSISDSQFSRNNATFNGGAVRFSSTDRAWVSKSNFTANTGLGTDSPAIYWVGSEWMDFNLNVSTLYLLESKFQNHTAGSPDSGVVLNYTGRIVLRGSEFHNNAAPLVSCKGRFDSETSQFVSLGGNSSDDGTCPR